MPRTRHSSAYESPVKPHSGNAHRIPVSFASKRARLGLSSAVSEDRKHLEGVAEREFSSATHDEPTKL